MEKRASFSTKSEAYAPEFRGSNEYDNNLASEIPNEFWQQMYTQNPGLKGFMDI